MAGTCLAAKFRTRKKTDLVVFVYDLGMIDLVWCHML